MSELNFELLQQNIRTLLRDKGITQQCLAQIAGMTQANVSKALNPRESKQFTLNQLYRISQHFGISLDRLVGNKAAEAQSTSPEAVLSFLTMLLCEAKLRTVAVTQEEVVYAQYCNDHGYPDCRVEKKAVSYTAFYLPDYHSVYDFAKDEIEAEETHQEFLYAGNEMKFKPVNEILGKLLPLIILYRTGEMPEEAFQMVLNGYLQQLDGK